MTEKLKITNQETTETKRVQLEEVAELEAPIKKIIEQIRDRIEGGEYGLVIGDDASGRVPALILGNFIKRISDLRKLPRPNIIFIPGKLIDYKSQGQESLYDERQERLEDHLEKWRADKSRKILIVTDTILTGRSLKELVRSIQDLGYGVDITAIGLEGDEEYFRDDRLVAFGEAEVFSGEYKSPPDSGYDGTPKIYQRHEVSGVEKTPGEEKSESYVKSVLDQPSREALQDMVIVSREDANIVVDHLVDWYESRKTK